MGENPDRDLYACWPDVPLCGLFRTARDAYEEMVRVEFEKRRTTEAAVERAFSNICDWVTSDANTQELRKLYGTSWLQAAASVLGMLMHLSVRGRRPILRNERRPGKELSTYPTAPAIARLAGEYVLGQVLREPVPRERLRIVDAERYAERALRFRVLDPSMESGQMLLAVAMALLARIEAVPASAQALRHWRTALVTRLCRDCLWGIDRNRLAAISVAAVFSALGREYGFELQPPRHLLTKDALQWAVAEPRKFEGIVNNPPWGERMSASERRWIRREFPLAGPRIDTYGAFTQLAIESLVENGVYALVLPAQAVSSQNAHQLRQMLGRRTELREILIAPRHAFVHATVRSCLLKGRVQETGPKSPCKATVYPFRKALHHRERERTIVLSAEALRTANDESWWMLFQENISAASTNRTIPLEMLAQVHLGCQLYGAGKGRPPQSPGIVKCRPYTSPRKLAGWMPAVQVRDVGELRIEPPSCFVRFGEWLAQPRRQDTLARRKRVLVRELCSREGRLKAGVSARGVIALHGVFSLIPAGIDAYVLAAILNSSRLAEYVRARSASFTKVDFQRITTAELRGIPIPIAALNESADDALRLAQLARQAHRFHEKAAKNRQKLIAEIDSLVQSMYGPR